MTSQSAPTAVRAPATGTYRIDPKGSHISFTIKHFWGLGKVRGSFSVRDGEFTVADQMSASTASATVDAASFDSKNAKRDADIRSAKFLDASAHPAISFTAQRLDVEGDRPVLTGSLTVRGVTRPVQVAIETCDPAGPEVHIKASAVVDRHEFGVSALKGMVARHIELQLDIVGVRA